MEGADLSSLAALQASLGRVALSRLSARITTRDLFETRILPVLAPVAIGDVRQPEAVLLQERLRARVAIERLPPEIFPDPTRAELYELLTTLPNPSGTLSLEVETGTGGGLGLPRFSRFLLSGLPSSAEEMWPALAGVTVSADWAADPPLGRVLDPPPDPGSPPAE
jgi:hypothetical protein